MYLKLPTEFMLKFNICFKMFFIITNIWFASNQAVLDGLLKEKDKLLESETGTRVFR